MENETQVTISVSKMQKIIDLAIANTTKQVVMEIERAPYICAPKTKGMGGLGCSLISAPEISEWMQNVKANIDIINNNVNIEMGNPNYPDSVGDDRVRICSIIEEHNKI